MVLLPAEVTRFHTRDRLRRVDWSRQPCAMWLTGWKIHVDAQLDTWLAWVDLTQRVIAVGQETWLILSGHGPALAAFIRVMTSGDADGLQSIPVTGEYRVAAKTYATATGQDMVRSKDAISVLEERARRLLESSVEDDPASYRRAVAELVEVREEMADLDERMGRLRTFVQLAGGILDDRG